MVGFGSVNLMNTTLRGTRRYVDQYGIGLFQDSPAAKKSQHRVWEKQQKKKKKGGGGGGGGGSNKPKGKKQQPQQKKPATKPATLTANSSPSKSSKENDSLDVIPVSRILLYNSS